MKDGKVIFQIQKVQLGGSGNVKAMYTVISDPDSPEDLVKAFISAGIQNKAFTEVLKYAVNALKKAETPLNPPPHYQA